MFLGISEKVGCEYILSYLNFLKNSAITWDIFLSKIKLRWKLRNCTL